MIFLTVAPAGSLGSECVSKRPKGLDALLVGAYSMIDGMYNLSLDWESAATNWVYGSIRGMEANKGTDSGDQPDINPIQTLY